ncbi:hypothetical protein [Gordoniibacillus kamchatkensis]|nr:hypothetical protein [Paenibacillus sp. VKM B-2647]
MKFLLGWTSFLWAYVIFSIHLLYHPIYTSEQALITEQNIKEGKGLFSGGFDGFIYLIYQFIGVIFMTGSLLFNIGIQIFTLLIWWGEDNQERFKNRILRKILYFLNHIYHPNLKFILFSILLIIIS